MKGAKTMALLGLLTLSALCGRVEGYYGSQQTYINNLSSKTIVGTTIYYFHYAHSSFVNRQIAPNTNQHDEYSGLDCALGSDLLDVELWVLGSCCENHVRVNCDVSLVAFDNDDKSGVDVYLAVYGDINAKAGSVLITIYP